MMASIPSDYLSDFKKEVSGGLDAYVVGEDAAVHNLFFKLMGFDQAPDLKSADVVVFTGGIDIHPKFYNEKPYAPKAVYNLDRDYHEFFAYKALSKAQVKLGICRGGQLLNVLNGGKLWQNVNNHSRNHKILDLDFDICLNVVSSHHQQMIPSFDKWNWIPVAVACKDVKDISTLCDFKEGASKRITLAHVKNTDKNAIWDSASIEEVDHEVLWYPEDSAFCFQGHPEYLTKDDTTMYFMDCVSEILTENKPFGRTNRKPTPYLQSLLNKGKKR